MNLDILGILALSTPFTPPYGEPAPTATADVVYLTFAAGGDVGLSFAVGGVIDLTFEVNP